MTNSQGQNSLGQISQSGGKPAPLPEVHELERQLAELDAGAEADVQQRIDLLNRLAWELSDTDSQRAIALSATAYDLASALPADERARETGIAYSLRTQGYLNQRFGNYPEGLKQLTRALAIFETLNCADGLPDVYDGLAGIYAQIGNFPEALSYTQRQLAAAEQIGDKRRIANAYNNFSCVYAFTGEIERAIAVQEQNLQSAVATGYPRIECIANMNLAALYLETGDPAQAREHALAGLRWSQEAGFEVFAVYAYQTLGNVSQKLDGPLEAIHYYEQALLASRSMESRVTESMLLFNLGRAHHTLQRFDLAIQYLQEAVAVSESIGARNELAEAHQALSIIYEEIGDPGRALAHFRQYHAKQELLAGEQANQRLQVLKVTYDTEQAKKEAEIAQLHAVELQKEVAARTAELTDTVAQLQNEVKERQRAEAEIQQLVETLEHRVASRTDELAAFYDLVVLAGQAADLGAIFEQVLARIMEVTRSRALCLHLFDTERMSLHLAGQQNLAGDGLAALQTVLLAAGFRRWLQQPNDPLTTIELATASLLPAELRLPAFQTYVGAQVKIGGHIEGVLSCYRSTNRGYGIDEIALVTALAQQIGLMLEIQRLRRQAGELAVVAERQRLARDLHDSVTQSLYSLTLFSRAGREAAADGDTVRLAESLAEVEDNTLHALREMRLLLYELRPADLQREGLQRALELRLNTVERRAGLQLDIHLGDLPDLPFHYELDLYHIVVESLNNIVKHAAASRVMVRIADVDGCLLLQIADDGKGFDPKWSSGGLGLGNIQERLARLDSQLVITSAPGCGTTLEAVIPYTLEDR